MKKIIFHLFFIGLVFAGVASAAPKAPPCPPGQQFCLEKCIQDDAATWENNAAGGKDCTPYYTCARELNARGNFVLTLTYHGFGHDTRKACHSGDSCGECYSRHYHVKTMATPTQI